MSFAKFKHSKQNLHCAFWRPGVLERPISLKYDQIKSRRRLLYFGESNVIGERELTELPFDKARKSVGDNELDARADVLLGKIE